MCQTAAALSSELNAMFCFATTHTSPELLSHCNDTGPSIESKFHYHSILENQFSIIIQLKFEESISISHITLALTIKTSELKRLRAKLAMLVLSLTT